MVCLASLGINKLFDYTTERSLLTENFLSIVKYIIEMILDFGIGMHRDNAMQMRYVSSYLEQLVNDHRELSLLWKRFFEEENHDENIDEIVKKISWLKQGITFLKHFLNTEIEGISFLKVKIIEEDLTFKEDYLQRNKFIVID